MLLRDLLANIAALGLDPETEVVVQTDGSGTYGGFELRVYNHEYAHGSTVLLPRPVQGLIDCVCSDRNPVM